MGLTSRKNSIGCEANTLELLFDRLPMGILLILNKTVLYHNKIAEEFYSKIVHTGFKVSISNAGGALSSMFRNKNRNVWEYHNGNRMYTVNASKHIWDKNEAFSVVISSAVKRCPDEDRKDPDVCYGLSIRQMEIAGLMMDGYTNKEIADELFLSVHTVNKHVCNILKKTKGKNRVAATCKIFGKDEYRSVCGALSQSSAHVYARGTARTGRA
jgi:DNA-binding CsgD family transcriptional regulator